MIVIVMKNLDPIYKIWSQKYEERKTIIFDSLVDKLKFEREMKNFKDFLMESKFNTVFTDFKDYSGKDISIIQTLQNAMERDFGEKLIKNGFVKVESNTGKMVTTANVIVRGNSKETFITYSITYNNTEAYIENDINPKKVDSSKHLMVISKLTSLPMDLLKASKITIISDLTPSYKLGNDRSSFQINITAPKQKAYDAILSLA